MRAHILLACCQRCRTALSSENGTTSPQVGSASQANRQAHTRSRSRLSIPDNRSVFLKSDTASLQLPDEYGSQEENDRYRSQNDTYQLIHGESSQILLWPTYSTGGRFALDRVSLRGQIARLPRRNLCSPLPLSGGSTHGLVPRDKAPWKSPQPTRHPPHGCQSGRFAGTADPRLGELAMCRPLTRGILKRYGTRTTSFGTNLMRCHFIDDRTGLAVSAASSLVFRRRITEQSSALRSQSMC